MIYRFICLLYQKRVPLANKRLDKVIKVKYETMIFLISQSDFYVHCFMIININMIIILNIQYF